MFTFHISASCVCVFFVHPKRATRKRCCYIMYTKFSVFFFILLFASSLALRSVLAVCLPWIKPPSIHPTDDSEPHARRRVVLGSGSRISHRRRREERDETRAEERRKKLMIFSSLRSRHSRCSRRDLLLWKTHKFVRWFVCDPSVGMATNQ
jgi:hypothetical protein